MQGANDGTTMRTTPSEPRWFISRGSYGIRRCENCPHDVARRRHVVAIV